MPSKVQPGNRGSLLPAITSELPADLRLWTDRARELIDLLVEQLECVTERTNRLLQDEDEGQYIHRGGGCDQLVNQHRRAVTRTPAANATQVEPPATPTNLKAVSHRDAVTLTWDVARYRGHKETEIWMSQANSQASARRVASTAESTYSYPSSDTQKRYFWVRFLNTEGVAGSFHSPTGVAGSAKADEPYYDTVLRGRIGSEQVKPQSLFERHIIPRTCTDANSATTTAASVAIPLTVKDHSRSLHVVVVGERAANSDLLTEETVSISVANAAGTVVLTAEGSDVISELRAAYIDTVTSCSLSGSQADGYSLNCSSSPVTRYIERDEFEVEGIKTVTAMASLVDPLTSTYTATFTKTAGIASMSCYIFSAMR